MIEKDELPEVKEGMVRCVKDGIVNDFSEMSYKMMSKLEGLIKFYDIKESDEIPTETITLGNAALDKREAELLKREQEFEAKMKALEVKEEPAKTDELSIDAMKAYLADKGVKVHHKAGDAKIKEMYYENRE